MEIKLSDQQKEKLKQNIISMYLDIFDEEISEFRALQIMDAFLEHAGPDIYNAAIDDAKHYIQARVEDLDALYKA